MKWLEKFGESLKRHSRASVHKEISIGIDAVPKGSTRAIRKKQSDWIVAALSKLDAMVDEGTRNRILADTCPHSYPKKRIREMKARLEELRSLDKLLELMRSDTSWGGGSFYDYPVREGNIIHVTKVPYKPSAYKAAVTDEEKRMTYCHCVIAKRSMKDMSPTFCCCSGGWVKQLWEGVLGMSLEVTLTESLLKGDDRCTHSFQIPSDFL